MINYKAKTFKIGFSILVGLSIASIPFVSANDDAASAETSEQRLTRMAAEKADKVARVEALAETWSAYTTEYKDTLFQSFYALSDLQLSAIEAADNYETVRSIAFGSGLVGAAKGVTAAAKLGDATEDLVYNPVTPCRIVDTRASGAGGDFTDGDVRSYFVYGPSVNGTDQGGDAGCNSPKAGDPSAVHININAIPRTPESNAGKGTVKVTPKGATPTSTVLVKYQLGTNASNAVSVITCRGCGEEIDVRTTGNPVDIVIEVLGYYYPVDEDDADRLVFAHGHVNTNGTKENGSETFVSSSWNASLERYEIVLSENYVFDEFTTVLTPITTCPNVTTQASSVSGELLAVFTQSTGASEGSKTQCQFYFVTFKNE